MGEALEKVYNNLLDNIKDIDAPLDKMVYEQLEQLHRDMHGAGDTLIKTVKTQQGNDAVIAATDEFLRLSELVDKEVTSIVSVSFAEGLRARNPEELIDKLEGAE